MARPRKSVVEPFWKSAPLSAATMDALDRLADPHLPGYAGANGEWIEYLEPDPARLYAFNPCPTRFTEWHKWCLLGLAYGFHTEGDWNEQECADGFAWAFTQDPKGVVALWTSVERDVEQGRKWDENPKDAPTWWLVRGLADLHRDGERPLPVIGRSRKVGRASREAPPKWDRIAADVRGELKRRGMDGNTLKVACARLEEAQRDWFTGFTKEFDAWTSARSKAIEEGKRRALRKR